MPPRARQVHGPAFLVVHDAAAWWSDPTVRRQLRDLSNALGPKQQTCFLVGCEARVPEELEKEVTVIDIPLPGREDVGKLLAALLKARAMGFRPIASAVRGWMPGLDGARLSASSRAS